MYYFASNPNTVTSKVVNWESKYFFIDANLIQVDLVDIVRLDWNENLGSYLSLSLLFMFSVSLMDFILQCVL